MANSGITNLYKVYNNNRKDEKELYLFKIGKFFCCLGDDAEKISSLIGLKVRTFSKELNKAGFPIESLEKYNKMIENFSYKFVIVIPNEGKSYTYEQYAMFLEEHQKDNSNKSYYKEQNEKRINDFISKLANIDVNGLKARDVCHTLEEIKREAKEIQTSYLR